MSVRVLEWEGVRWHEVDLPCGTKVRASGTRITCVDPRGRGVRLVITEAPNVGTLRIARKDLIEFSSDWRSVGGTEFTLGLMRDTIPQVIELLQSLVKEEDDE